MQLDIRTKGVKITDEIKGNLRKKLEKLDKFTTRPLDAKVMIKTEAKMVKVEVTIPVGPITIRAEETDQELFNAIDKCANRLEKQIKSNKHKLVRSLQDKDGVNDLFIDSPEPDKMVNSAVKIKQYKLEILSFDEAVTQLELLDHSFFAYKNEKENVCIVYLRKDGEYGLIETF